MTFEATPHPLRWPWPAHKLQASCGIRSWPSLELARHLCSWGKATTCHSPRGRRWRSGDPRYPVMSATLGKACLLLGVTIARAA